MSNGQTSVYLARGPIEIAPERKQLEEELTGRGYKVKPGFALDATYGLEALVKEMEPCSRAIFLLGGKHDKFVEQQIKQAVALQKPSLFWIHPRLAENASPEQQLLLNRLRERQDLPKGSEILGGHSITALLQQLEPLLKNDTKPQPRSAESNKPRVYLIFDATLSAESEAASSLTGILSERNLEVIQSKSYDDHEDLMGSSDAALLLRTTKPQPDLWLRSYAREVILSKEIFQKDPDFAAKALLIADPARLRLNAGDIPVFAYSDSFSPTTLDPFFEKLQRSRSADAGR